MSTTKIVSHQYYKVCKCVCCIYTLKQLNGFECFLTPFMYKV